MKPTTAADSENQDGLEDFKAKVRQFKDSGKVLPDPMAQADPLSHGNQAPGLKEHGRLKARKIEVMPLPEAHTIFYIPEVLRIGEALLGQDVTEEDLLDIIILPKMKNHLPARLVRSKSYPFFYRVTPEGCPCKGWYFSAKRGEAHCSHHDQAFPEVAQENKLRYAEVQAALKDPSKVLPPARASEISSEGFKPVADELPPEELGRVIEGHPTNARDLPVAIMEAMDAARVPYVSVELKKGKGLQIKVPRGTSFDSVEQVLQAVAPGRLATVSGA
jgi:hypothetical protein